jgi:hypothetical protein
MEAVSADYLPADDSSDGLSDLEDAILKDME